MSTLSKLHNRFASVAGQYYPATQAELNTELSRLYALATPPQGSDPLALIVPFSGYMFSGKTAASAYNQLDPEKQYKRIFVLTSARMNNFIGASVFCDGDYVVPNGIAEVDILYGRTIVEEHPNLFTDARTPHYHEHSIEVQLPFILHKVRKPFKIVPIVIGTHTPEVCRQLAQVLKPELHSGNLFIISTDFSGVLQESAAKVLDEETGAAIATNSPERLIKVLNKHEKLQIPGYVASLYSWSSVLTLLYMSQGEEQAIYTTVDSCTSGDIPYYGNREKVTGYKAITLTRRLPESQTTGISTPERNDFLFKTVNTLRNLFKSPHKKDKKGS